MRFEMLRVYLPPVLTVCGLFDSTNFTMATDCLSHIYMVSKECFMRLLTNSGLVFDILVARFKMSYVYSSKFSALMCV